MLKKNETKIHFIQDVKSKSPNTGGRRTSVRELTAPNNRNPLDINSPGLILYLI